MKKFEEVFKLYVEKENFDVVLGFQILEYIPFEKSKNTLRKIKNMTNHYPIISILHEFIDFSSSFKFPMKNTKAILFPTIDIPLRFAKNNEHYWEVGTKVSYKLFRDFLEQHFIKNDFRNSFFFHITIFFNIEPRL